MGEDKKKKTKPKKADDNFYFKLSVVFCVLMTFAAFNIFTVNTTEKEESVSRVKTGGRSIDKKHSVREDAPPDEEEDIWDVLMLVQQWPETFCKIKFNKPSRITCRYPADNSLWTVHGLWPTKRGTRGPNDCAINNHLNVDQLTPIKDDLNYYWPNLIASASNQKFWSYEWRKHGTCALDHEDLDSQLKYFKRAVDIAKAKNMKDVLDARGVNPSVQNGFPLVDVLNAISRRHRGRPDIQCHYDTTTGRHLLKEIRICFDRLNNEVDCDREGNCPHGKDIFYPPAESSA